MNILSRSVVAAALLGAAAGNGWCAEAKIAVVDMARIVRGHPDTPAADSLLEKQLEEFQAEQKDMEGEFDKQKKAFEEARKEAINKALSESAREEKTQAAEEKLVAVREYDRKMRETLNSRQKQLSEQSLRMRKRIVEKIQDQIRAYAADKGYALVLDTAAVGMSGVEIVLFSSDKVDITEDLMKIIGKSKPADAKAADAKPPEAKAAPAKAAEDKPAAAKE